jgi:hypothetical protein
VEAVAVDMLQIYRLFCLNYVSIFSFIIFYYKNDLNKKSIY